MARPPPQGPGAKPLVPPLIGDEIFEVISSGGLRQIVTLQQIAEFVGGGGGVIATVPNGGTGLGALTLNGILYGNGVAPVGVTAAAAEGNVLVTGSGGVPQWTAGPGSDGDVLTSNGPAAIPSFQPFSAGYPPSPTPNFQTYLQDQFTAGNSVDWIWGNVVLNNPVVVNLNQNSNSFTIDLHGAVISPSSSYPVDTTVDMVTLIVPNSAPATNIQGFRMLNGNFLGVNPSSVAVCRNVVAIACQLNASGIYNGSIMGCQFIAGSRSGLQLYGSVFEFDLVSCGARDNGYAGIECRNPNVSGAGIISSINLFGGDCRTNGTGGTGNGYGLALTAESAFQEPLGIYVHSTNFIVNSSAGVLCPAGIALIIGAHFENNCNTNGGETNGAIWCTGGGTLILYEIEATHATGNGQTYVYQAVSGGGSAYKIEHCFSFNEDTDATELTGVSSGTATVFADSTSTPTNYSGGGALTTRINTTQNTSGL